MPAFTCASSGQAAYMWNTSTKKNPFLHLFDHWLISVLEQISSLFVINQPLNKTAPSYILWFLIYSLVSVIFTGFSHIPLCLKYSLVFEFSYIHRFLLYLPVSLIFTNFSDIHQFMWSSDSTVFFLLGPLKLKMAKCNTATWTWILLLYMEQENNWLGI